MTNPTIDSVEERLRVARQQVADLETLLHQLKHEETNRKMAKQPPIHSNNDIHESEPSCFLEGSTLQLILEWLNPLDLVRCLLVSKRWKEEIDRPLIWKQAVSRAIPSDLWNAMNPDSESSSYYKRMVVSIVEKPRQQVDIIAERQATSKGVKNYWLPSTTLVPDKVFLMVNVCWKATGEVFGSWRKSFADWIPSESDFGFQMIGPDHNGAIQLPATPLQGKLDDHFAEFYNPDPTRDVPTKIYDSISFSFRCVRTDTGESLHLGTDQDFDQYDDHLWAYLDTDIGAPTARNDAGCRARELWALKQFTRGGFSLRFNVRPFPPSEAHHGITLESWHGTTYLLDGLECDFVAYYQDGDYDDYKNLQELLVSLDGYLWS